MFHLSYIFPTTTYIFFPCNFLSTGIFHAVSVLTYYGTNVPISWSMATGAQHPLPHRPTHVYTHCLMFMTHTGQPIKHFLSPFWLKKCKYTNLFGFAEALKIYTQLLFPAN
jgi:hypothetical protein